MPTLYDSQGRILHRAGVTLVDTTSTEIVAAVTGFAIYVVSMMVTAGAATNLSFLSAANIIIPSDATVGGGIPLGGLGAGFLYDGGDNGWLMETNVSEALNLRQSVGTRLVGSLNYVLIGP